MRFDWQFDAPTGVYMSPGLTRYLLDLSQEEGPRVQFAPVQLEEGQKLTEFAWAEPLTIEHEALIRQARLLRDMFPLLTPHLRAAIPADYGRTKAVCWYDAGFDRQLIGENYRVPGAIKARDVVPRFLRRVG